MSNDCVFFGAKGMYMEADVSDAEDLYGRSKYLGEVDYLRSLSAMRKTSRRHGCRYAHHEWPAERASLLDAVRVIIAQHDKTKRVMKPVADYEAGPVSKHILRIVLSYVDYVNRTIWSK